MEGYVGEAVLWEQDDERGDGVDNGGGRDAVGGGGRGVSLRHDRFQFLQRYVSSDPDTYTLTRNSDSASIPITTTGIAWANDKSLYKNSNLSTQGIDVVNNEHWLVWLRPAVTSNFYKLWGVIGGGLVRGNYTMVVGNGNG